MLIDFEHHYIPAELARRWQPDVPPNLTSLEKRIEYMDEAGVDLSVVTCPLGWNAPWDLCREVNNQMAALQATWPDRFAALAHLPLVETSLQVKELARAITELGLKGVIITAPAGAGGMLDDESLWPLYEFLEESHRLLFVHPNTHTTEKFPFCDTQPLVAALGWEFQLLIAYCRMASKGIFERFSGLQFVFAHLAGGLPALIDRLEKRAVLKHHLRQQPNLFFCLSGSEGGFASLGCAMQAFRPEQLLFASDYPYDFPSPGGLKAFARKIGSLSSKPSQPLQIHSETARRLLALPL